MKLPGSYEHVPKVPRAFLGGVFIWQGIILSMRPVIYLAILPLAVLVGVLHTFAITHYFYWRFFWFDMVVHLSAGALAGLLFYIFARYYMTPPRAAAYGILGALLVGVLWEYFEFANGVSQYVAGFWFDTGKDLLMDILGGTAAVLICAKKDL
jgi:hypothetical protein